VVEAPLGEAADASRLREVLASLAPPAVVLTQHCDTSTGVLNDLAALGAVTRAAGALLVADAVATVGAAPIAMSATGVDVVLGTSQKGLGCVPGVAFAVLGQRAWARGDEVATPRYSLDWRRQTSVDDSTVRGGHTPAVTIIAAMAVALAELRANGLESFWQQQVSLGERVRAGVRAAGLSVVAGEQCAAPMVTAVHLAQADQVRQDLLAEHGIVLPHSAGAMLRIGHFLSQAGHVEETLRALAARVGGGRD
jgi:aspartate aminotransferase-like enzyme